MKGKRFMAGFLSLMLVFSTMTSTSYAMEFSSEVSSEAEILETEPVEEIENSAEFSTSEETIPAELEPDSVFSIPEETVPAELEPDSVFSVPEETTPAESEPDSVFSAPEETAPAESEPDSDIFTSEETAEEEFTGSLENIEVTVKAPEGAFPAGTTLKVDKASEAAVQAASEAAKADKADVEAVDITFADTEGQKVQPAKAVEVSMKYSKEYDADKIKVLHVIESGDGSAEAEAVANIQVNTEKKTVTFDAESFSVYAVVYVPDEENTSQPAKAPGQEDEKNTYTFEIKYTFADGTTAAQSYTGTFAKGSAYSKSVSNPVITGYKATLTTTPASVTVDFSEAALSYSFENISSDITLNVVYVADYVNYTVKYYQQNINDDEYTLFETDTKTGLTGSVVSETYENTKDKYNGFYGLRFETPTIAADGSTVVEIKYDRNYYLINFDLAGGYGVEPIYARYGTPISVTDPTRPGYGFKGWNKTIAATMPVGGDTYTATWEAADAKVTVVFWYENADDTNYSYAGSATVNAKAGNTVSSGDYSNTNFDGRDTTHFTYNRNKTETVTVAGDGSTVVNVYFTRNTYTLTFKKSSGNTTYQVITAKYQAYIADQWPLAGQKYGNYTKVPSNLYGWSDGSTTFATKRFTMTDDLCKTNGLTLTSKTGNTTTYTINYWMEALDGTGEKVGNTYYQIDSRYSQTLVYPSNQKSWGYKDIDGFKATSDNATVNNNTFNLYYTRNRNTITFYDNYGTTVASVSDVMFEMPLSNVTYNGAAISAIRPAYPSTLEAGAYEFGGWYTVSGCYDGTEADFDNGIMPNAPLSFYAKWVPVTHDVKVYSTENGSQIGETQKVAHGALAVAPETPTNGSYDFIGWFYRDANGNEKAFDFASMPVRQDLEIYAKWSSNVLKDYTVKYVLEDGTEIAAQTTGSALAGTTKTFEAKTGNALYDDYTEGYFPQENSHSLTLDIDDDSQNIYSFVYKEAEAVPYQVKYVNAATGEELIATKMVSDNRKAVVTETAAAISGYLPDSYQKRLVITYSDSETPTAENTLIFYYTEDSTHAYVIDKHYLLPLDSTDESKATEYAVNTETGTIGQEYTRGAQTIANYVLDHVKVNDEEVTGENIASVTRTLSAAGLVFEFYYRPQVFYIYHSSTGAKETVFMGDRKADGTYDITKKAINGYYGGYYSAVAKEGTPYTGQAGIWNKSKAYTISGTSMTPVAGTTYYLKEVPTGYLRPYLQVVYNTYYGNKLSAIYLMTAIDDTNYTDIGLKVTNNVTGKRLALSMSYTIKEENTTIKLTPATAFGSYGVTRGYLGVWDANAALDTENTSFTYQAYWTTPDGVTVTGDVTRSVNTGNNTYQNFMKPGITYND